MRRCRRFIFVSLLTTIFFFITRSTLFDKSSCSINDEQIDIDREDPWRYQNSVTGQWFHWRFKTTNQSWPIRWLNTSPQSFLGVIVYLARQSEFNELNRSLSQISLLLIDIVRPVVIFHEGDLNDDAIQNALAQTLNRRIPLAFERIDFSNDTNQPASVHRIYPRKYFAMCRFFTRMLSTHPIGYLFTFIWRLDTHSYIFSDRSIIDPFVLMKQRRIQYAFLMTNEEGSGYVTELWPLFHRFLQKYCLRPSSAVVQTQTTWFSRYSHDIIFTNFAIFNVSMWRDHRWIRLWLDEVDRNGGIYRYRWGDAPIHTLALTQFLQRDEIIRLRYFGYFHRREYVCPNEISDDECRRQISPFLLDRHVKYIRFENGCFLPHSSLCNYYSQVTH